MEEEKREEVKKKSWPRRHPILTALIVLFAIGVIGAAMGGDTAQNTSTTGSNNTANTNQQTQNTEPEPTEDPNPHFEDGTFVVGKDIQPGMYRTRQGSSGCYYARLSGFGGDLDEILSNENTDYPAVVTIQETDKGFKSTRCGTWTQDLSQITKSKTEFNDGIYIIGTDIEPGTYKSSGQSGCYYSRLRGFTGGIGDIISNENTDEAAIVTIGAADKGFKSARCGTWKLQ